MKDSDKEYYTTLLKNRNLFWELVLDGLDEIMVGEDIVRKTIFLCGIGSLVLNSSRTSFNLMVNSESGAGKDYVVDNVLKLFSSIENMVHKRTRISPTALTYWHDSKWEPSWTWDGKLLYLEDCSNDILNCDVFKVFTSGGSHATIVKDQRAIDIKIIGKPVVIITSASANPEPELIRRFIVVNLDESEKQTKEVMEKWADFNKKGELPKIKNEYGEALFLLKPRKVKIPYVKEILELFPKKHIIMRTHFGRFCDFVKASAVLHQYARKNDEDDYIIADGQDYDYAREIIMATTYNDQMVPLTQNQREVLNIMEELDPNFVGEGLEKQKIGFTIEELLGSFPLSKTQLYRELNKLVKMGFVKKISYRFEYDKRSSILYEVKEQVNINLPKWEKTGIKEEIHIADKWIEETTPLSKFQPKSIESSKIQKH